ncbi:MAG: hypothetical protein IJ125_07095, partial [Atopobiaceae bacterium]|nr:hypothetical protein [Atopobiaceae bacterium]
MGHLFSSLRPTHYIRVFERSTVLKNATVCKRDPQTKKLPAVGSSGIHLAESWGFAAPRLRATLSGSAASKLARFARKCPLDISALTG